MISYGTHIYERETGKKPRGLGHWAFYLNISNEELTKHECPFEHYKSDIRNRTLVWASDVMLLSQAKKELTDWLKSKGVKSAIIEVAS